MNPMRLAGLAETLVFPRLKWLVPIVHLVIRDFIQSPMPIKKIKLRDGTEIDTTPETKVVMKDSTAFMITDMLKSVLVSPGTGIAAKVPGFQLRKNRDNKLYRCKK